MAGEWKDIAFGNCAQRVSDVVQPQQVAERTPYIGLEHIVEGGLHLNGQAVASEATSAKTRFRRGDVLFGKLRPYFRKVVRPKFDGICSTDIWAVRAKNGVDQGFLFYRMASQEFVDKSMGASTGTRMPRADWGFLSQWDMPLPPLAEQKTIASVLGALDDKIELNRRMNATLEAMARALFQSWFVDFDPVRAKLDGRKPVGLDDTTAALFPDHFEDSPPEHIPKGWTAGKLGDIGTNSRRGVPPRDIAPNTPYIALEHMPRRCIALGDWDNSADVASCKSAFKKGEILFGKLRPYFHKVGVAPFDGVCSTDILVLAPKSPEWFGFLLGHASRDELIQFTDLASTGTKMPRTNWSDISSFRVALPPKAIADAFTRIIQPMLDRIHTNLHQSRTLVNLRDALLPKLLSGELRVTSDHMQAAEQA